MGRHRAPPPNYALRRIVAGVLAVVVVGGLVWFFFLRGGSCSQGGDPPRPFEEYRAELVENYTELRSREQAIIQLVMPIDEGQDLSTDQVALLRQEYDLAEAAYTAVDELRRPPQELAQDYNSLRPTANEFVALARRTLEALEAGTELPTSTPGVQLQSLLDLQPPPDQLATCG